MQKRVDRDVVRLLNIALRDLEKQLRSIRGKTSISARVEEAQLQSVAAAIQRTLAELFDSLGQTAAARQAEAAAVAIEQAWDWDQILLTRIGLTADQRAAMKASLLQTADRSVQAAVTRITGGGMPLSRRVYRTRDLSSGLVDRRINSALARGLNWSQFAGEVKGLINPNTAGGVSYAAKRLARTEINNAYHAMSVAQTRDKPWATGMKWNLSRSHPEPDLCDLYADRGPYQPDAVPAKPHPHCLCYVTPELVDYDTFLGEYRAGRYDSYLAENYGVRSREVA